ncbi:hypothetical protein BDQ17DRAFT_1429607 [Cyathus striatus]|nr:hypothetical protein BDQ17DRAFT_1429607 [Cyathus striatus]
MSYPYSTHGSPFAPSSSDKSYHRSSVHSHQTVSSWGTVDSVQTFPQVNGLPSAPLMQYVPLPAVSPYPQQAMLPQSPPVGAPMQIHWVLTNGTTVLDFASDKPPLCDVDLRTPATNPPVSELCITPPSYLSQLWTIKVQQPGGYITVGSILGAIYQNFRCVEVTPQEYTQLPLGDAEISFRNRTGKSLKHYPGGVMRMDFLRGSALSVRISLSATREGTMAWRLHLDPPQHRYQN